MNKKNIFCLLLLLFAAYSVQHVSAMESQIEKGLSEKEIDEMYRDEMEEMFKFSETLRKNGYSEEKIREEEAKERERINWRRRARNKLRRYPNFDLSKL